MNNRCEQCGTPVHACMCLLTLHESFTHMERGKEKCVEGREREREREREIEKEREEEEDEVGIWLRPTWPHSV